MVTTAEKKKCMKYGQGTKRKKMDKELIEGSKIIYEQRKLRKLFY